MGSWIRVEGWGARRFFNDRSGLSVLLHPPSRLDHSLAVANDSVAFIFLISLTIFFFVLTANLMSKASNYSSLVEATFVLTMSLIMTACNFLL